MVALSAVNSNVYGLDVRDRKSYMPIKIKNVFNFQESQRLQRFSHVERIPEVT